MDIQKLFDEVKLSFPEVKSKLISFNKESFMLSSPLTGNIYYDPNQIKKYNFSEKALKGILAHELSHQIDYKTKSIFLRLFFKFKYINNIKFKKQIEREADKIAIQRGFGEELKQFLKECEKKYEPERFEKRIKPFHLTSSEINKINSK